MSESRHYYGSSYNSSNEVYLGFDNLRNQVHRKSAKKGFDFTLCLVGELGKVKSDLESDSESGWINVIIH